MTASEVAPPGGLDERATAWHVEQFIDFTRKKLEVGEPSPHLAMMKAFTDGHQLAERAWRLCCYAAVYSLPTAQMLWDTWPLERVLRNPEALTAWVHENWAGMVTRRERRCVRSAKKLSRCLRSSMDWVVGELESVTTMPPEETPEAYDRVWESVLNIDFIGRYIGIRLIEGLRRFCGVPARLYDIRSVGGWSPKKALVYFYPDDAAQLLTPGQAGEECTGRRANELLVRTQEVLPAVDHYVVAAMLCEYREAFEDHHQYPGWTIDQEPDLYTKASGYWGDALDSRAFWQARTDLFPRAVLGEHNDWRGTRWPLTKLLRDNGYNWSDLRYDYVSTARIGSWASPVARSEDAQ